MIFLRVFAQLVVETWRQFEIVDGLPTAGVYAGTLTRRWLAAFEILCDRALDKMTIIGALDALDERSGRVA